MENLFYFLSFTTVFMALLVVLSKNPIHSILYLVITMFTIAAHYMLLNAQFLLAVHIVVYAGAIMVLFLFVLMFLNLNVVEEKHKPLFIRLSGIVAGGTLFVVLVASLKGAYSMAATNPDPSVGLIENMGTVLFGEFALPFEVASILLLSAMIGAVMLGKKDDIQDDILPNNGPNTPSKEQELIQF